MAKENSQLKQQYQQLKLVLSAVSNSSIGKHFGLNEIPDSIFKKTEKAHIAFVENTDIMSYESFIHLLGGLAEEDKVEYVIQDLLLRPNLLTNKEFGGLCPLHWQNGILPITKFQLEMMVNKQEDFHKKIFKENNLGSKSIPFNIYKHPLLTLFGEQRVPCTGIDTLLAQPRKKFFGTTNVAMPNIDVLQAAGKSESQRLKVYSELLEQHGNKVEVLRTSARLLSDIGFQLTSQRQRNVRLPEVCPNLKAVILKSIDMSPYQVGMSNFMQGQNVPIYGEVYTSFGLFGNSVKNGNVDDIQPVLDAGVFFEFIPIEDIDESTGKLKSICRRLDVANIEENQEYVLIVSSVAGLLGLNTNIVVRIKNKDPLVLNFVRPLLVLNGLNEKLSSDQTTSIIKELNDVIVKSYQLYMREYMVGDHIDREQAIWVIELNQDPKDVSPQVLKSIVNRIHLELSKVNRSYLRALDKGSFYAPIFSFVPPGTFLQVGRSKIFGHFDLTPEGRYVRRIMSRAGESQVKVRAVKISS